MSVIKGFQCLASLDLTEPSAKYDSIMIPNSEVQQRCPAVAASVMLRLAGFPIHQVGQTGSKQCGCGLNSDP